MCCGCHDEQITKHALAKRVVDARNPGRKLTMADQTLDLDAEYSRYEVNEDMSGFNLKQTFVSTPASMLPCSVAAVA